MQLCNCQVAIAGDLNNKGVLFNITPAEVETLRMIHGRGSVSDIEIVGKMEPREYSQEDLYLQLKSKYPLHEEKIKDYWRDRGANLPTDVRMLDLPEGSFRLPPDMMIERLRVAERPQPEPEPDDEPEEEDDDRPIDKKAKGKKARPVRVIEPETLDEE